MLQTNYNLPIDLEIVCENETLKKVVGTAGVESARRTREQWNYMPVLCYMRFSPYSIRVKLNRFADPNKKYSCIFYIDDKAMISTTPLKINHTWTWDGKYNGNKKYPFEFDLAILLFESLQDQFHLQETVIHVKHETYPYMHPIFLKHKHP